MSIDALETYRRRRLVGVLVGAALVTAAVLVPVVLYMRSERERRENNDCHPTNEVKKDIILLTSGNSVQPMPVEKTLWVCDETGETWWE